MIRVFYKTAPSETLPPSNREVLNGNKTTTEQLQALRDEIGKEANETKRQNLQRKLARLERFEKVQGGLVTEESKKDELSKILKWKNTENYLWSDLLSLRKRGVDIANLVLVNKSDSLKEVQSWGISIWETFVVNFGGNQSLKWDIGAWDILPPEVQKAKINWVEWERRNTPRPGYYAGRKYLPIFDGDIIEITVKSTITEEARVAAVWANETRLKTLRIDDTIKNNGAALSELEEDIKIVESAKQELAEKQKLNDTIGKIREWWFYGTNKPISDTIKLMADLSPKESVGLARKVFKDGPATELLIILDGWTGEMIKRMVALGYHEGWLKFGRGFSTGWDIDPSSWRNLWTFQIGGRGSTYEDSLKKYQNCTDEWIKLAKQYGISIDYDALSDAGQRDLITHFWYIQSQRGGSSTFDKLRDSSLSEREVITLMHDKIQWWIPAIWKSVVAQINTTKIDTTTLT